MIKGTKVVYLRGREGTHHEKSNLLEKTFHEYRPVLLRFLAARLVLEEDREDLIQELFLKLINLPDLDQKLSAITGDTASYLFTIANNLVIDRQRQQAARKSGLHSRFEENSLPSDHSNPERITATQGQLNRLMDTLKNIQPKYRNVLILNRFMHKSCREIAVEMGISEATAERYLARALMALRRGLK